MAYITIVQAAKDFKVTRSRIYRAIDNGSITSHIGDDGTKLVDPADMVRVFGGKHKKIVPSKSEQPVTQQSEQLVEMLKEQLKQAQEREAFYKSEIANIRKDFDDFKLLIGMKNQPDNTPQNLSPTDTKTELSEPVPNIQNNTSQTGQGEQCNDVVIQSEIRTKKRGLFGRVFNAVFEGE